MIAHSHSLNKDTPEDIKHIYYEILAGFESITVIDSCHPEQRVTTYAFTGAVLLMRKLLMHFAVDCGAPTGKSFSYYQEYLLAPQNGILPSHAKFQAKMTDFVSAVRKQGNIANHELIICTSDEAHAIFKGILLILINFGYAEDH